MTYHCISESPVAVSLYIHTFLVSGTLLRTLVSYSTMILATSSLVIGLLYAAFSIVGWVVAPILFAKQNDWVASHHAFPHVSTTGTSFAGSGIILTGVSVTSAVF